LMSVAVAFVVVVFIGEGLSSIVEGSGNVIPLYHSHNVTLF
jgi:hypothetical protein